MRQATNWNTSSLGDIALKLGGVLMLLALSFGGCRDSAPDDIIIEVETTEALVFVKT